jgi:hypothetical protein
MATSKALKKIYLLCVALIVFIAAVFYYIWQKEAKENALLLDRGVRGDAWVLDIYGRKTTKKSSPNYYMSVAFFADTSITIPVAKDTAILQAKNGADLVDKIFNQMHKSDKPIGNYQTLTIALSKVEAEKYKKDDKVKIVYLKEDPTVVKLLEQVE